MCQFVLSSTQTQILIIARSINIKNRSVHLLKFIIQSFSNLRTTWTVITHNAWTRKIIIIFLSIKSMLIKILVLVNWIWVSDSRFVTFFWICAWIVHQKAFQVYCHLTAWKFVVIENGLWNIRYINASVTLSWDEELIFLQIGELLIKFQ